MALDPDLMRLALHESSHALVSSWLGIPVVRVWIDPREGKGECVFDRDSPGWSPEAELYGSIASGVAEYTAFGDVELTNDDHIRSKKLAEVIDPQNPEAYLLHATRQVEQIILQSWPGLISLTHVLARHHQLDGQQVRSIVREGMATAVTTPVRSSATRR